MRGAEEALSAGDYERAMAEAERAMALSKDLERYEQKESSEQQYRSRSSGEVYKKAAAQKREMGRDNRADSDADMGWDQPEQPQQGLSDGALSSDLLITGGQSGGVGARGSGLGGGGSAEGLGGLGTVGRGSGSSGYGSGGGDFGAVSSPALVVVSEQEVIINEPELMIVQPARMMIEEEAPTEAVSAVAVSGDAVITKEYLEKIPTGRSYQSAVQSVPGVQSRSAGGKLGKADKGLPADAKSPAIAPISATTLAIPLPDHGQHVEVSQSLLEPGEASTLVLRYRMPRR